MEKEDKAVDKVTLPDEVKKKHSEPTHWSLYECGLGLSQRIWNLETKINILIVISVVNLICLLTVLLV